jgi:hypothetical protein
MNIRRKMNTEIMTQNTMQDIQFHKYQKVKAMQSFRQKFSEMIREYRDGYRNQRSCVDRQIQLGNGVGE